MEAQPAGRPFRRVRLWSRRGHLSRSTSRQAQQSQSTVLRLLLEACDALRRSHYRQRAHRHLFPQGAALTGLSRSSCSMLCPTRRTLQTDVRGMRCHRGSSKCTAWCQPRSLPSDAPSSCSCSNPHTALGQCSRALHPRSRDSQRRMQSHPCDTCRTQQPW